MEIRTEEQKNNDVNIYLSDGQMLNEEEIKQKNIKDEVLVVENLYDIPTMAAKSLNKEYNAVVLCRRGKIELEIDGVRRTAGDEKVQGKKMVVNAGKMLLMPSSKLFQPMMVSTDMIASALLVSDNMLREVLGTHINLWNQAMFLKEIYVINGDEWIYYFGKYTKQFLIPKEDTTRKVLYRDIAISILRTLFLLICEELNKINNITEQPQYDDSTVRERKIFDQFLLLLSNEKYKRQQVGYYASLLNITPKYLSTVCKRVSGKSPIRWIKESVMNEIYQMLRDTDLSVKEISNKLGFPNSSFFGQFFREEAGMTPLSYRKKRQTK